MRWSGFRFTPQTAQQRSSTLIQDAVVRNLEVVGEAVKQLPSEVRDLASDVPWRRIAGMRDVLIHEYFGVDLEVVWRVVEFELPRLHSAVTLMLQRLNTGTSSP